MVCCQIFFIEISTICCIISLIIHTNQYFKDVAIKTRNPELTRKHILNIAFEEIYQNGFQGVSIDRIVAKTNVTKGAFFHHFSNKQQLGYAIVDELLSSMIMSRWIAPLAAYKNPLKGMLSQFKKNIDETPNEHICYGCPLNNLIQEMAPVDPLFKEKLGKVIALWISENEKYLIKAQNLGYLRKNVNTRQLAEFIVMVEEASYGLGKSIGDKSIHLSAYYSLKKYISLLT